MSRYQQLLATTAAFALCATGAFAQAPAGALEEVVVTATRQSDTVNRVPLSITAQTQRTLDQTGVKSLADLVGAAPALTLNAQGSPSVANVAIRGISDNGLGSATTGFYLDDTPLQKRNAGGSFQANGTPLPPLFDLERVEVLRGPQGTLFGGSSEGGTIRYITPQPSLTKYSVYAKGDVFGTKGGDVSYEAGAAVGGPIVQDKLGFRVSYDDRHQGGWIDTVNRISAQPQFTNDNSGHTNVLRGALAWAPTDRSRVTFSYLQSFEHYDSYQTSYSPNMNGPIVVNPVCFNTTVPTAAKPVLNPTSVACPANALPGQTVGGIYERPGTTLGPYPQLGPGTTIFNYVPQPSTSNVFVPSLTLEYDFPAFTVKSITSHIYDEEKITSANVWVGIQNSNGSFSYNGVNFTSGFNSVPGIPNYNFTDENIPSINASRAWTEELRFSSPSDAKPFSWVAGMFYSDKRNAQAYQYSYGGFDAAARYLYGLSGKQRFGDAFFDANGVPTGTNVQQQALRDIEMSGYGEANYWITDKLRATAGLRYEHVISKYWALGFGPLKAITPAQSLGGAGRSAGKFDGTPVTPKGELEYQFTDNDMAYITAAKGFRPGGVNSPGTPATCATAFANLGLPFAIPATFNSDSVWNYEVGGKFRLFNNRVQLNASAYRIDWTNPQLAINLGFGCTAFIGNAGKARSQGFEMEAQAKIAGGLSGNLAIGYDDAQYTQDAIYLQGPLSTAYAAYKGQHIQVPPFTAEFGLRYDFDLMGKSSYIRGDYRYVAHYTHTLTQDFSFDNLPNNNYSPDNVYMNTSRLNVRAGMEFRGLDINVYANNVFNNQDGILAGSTAAFGRGTCAVASKGGTAACTSFSQYFPYGSLQPASMPRQIGIQVVYRQ